MSIRSLCLVFLSAVSTFVHASEPSAPAVAPSAEASATAAAPTEAKAIIEETELSMAMARDGQFGRIKGREMKRLESAFSHIMETLGQVDTLAELNTQQAQSLALARSQFSEILKPEDENRKICKRVASTGTRLGALECLTLAERRARARASRNLVSDAQRGFCVPGEGTPCVMGGGGG